MIAFKDFAPEQLSPARLFQQAQFENFTAAVNRANRWLASQPVELITIETVVLPNVHSPHEDGTEDASLASSGDFATTWHQLVRVWYRPAG